MSVSRDHDPRLLANVARPPRYRLLDGLHGLIPNFSGFLNLVVDKRMLFGDVINFIARQDVSRIIKPGLVHER